MLPDGSWAVGADEVKNDGSRPLATLDFLRGAPIAELRLQNLRVSDISALRGMQLRLLSIREMPVERLDALAGMPLKQLDLTGTLVSDLEPVRGLPLEQLCLEKTRVADLAPLAGMPLRDLWLGESAVRDLRPLRGIPLRALHLQDCAIEDVSPLLDVPRLEHLRLPKLGRNVDLLRAHPGLKFISFDFDAHARRPKHSAEEFWSVDKAASEEQLSKQKRFPELERLLRLRLSKRKSTEESMDYTKLAAVLLAQGKLQDYRDLCAEMRERFKLANPEATLSVCSLATLHPDDVPEVRKVYDEARRFIGEPSSSGWLSLAVGIGAHRLNEPDEARTSLTAYSKTARGYASQVIARAVWAMLHCRIGDIHAAAADLAKAREHVARERGEVHGRDGWVSLLIPELLEAEATSLLSALADARGTPMPSIPSIEDYWNVSAAREAELARAGRSSDLEKMLANRVDRGSSDNPQFDRLKLAVLALDRGDHATYEALCAAARERLAPLDPAAATTTFFLSMHGGVSPEAAEIFRQACEAQNQAEHLRPWTQFPCALAAYRCGRLDDAEALLRQLLWAPDLHEFLGASGRALLAMIHIQRNNHASAKTEQLVAMRLLDRRRLGHGYDDWGYWSVARRLITEAGALIDQSDALADGR